MNIPNIPTDNLYKFMALTGVFLFVISLITPQYIKYNIKNDQLEHNYRVALLNYDIENLNTEIVLLADNVKEKRLLLQEHNNVLESGGTPDSINKDEIEIYADESEKKSLILSEKNIELYKKILELDMKQNKVKFNIETYKMLKIISFIMIFVSLTLSSFGFIMWYKKNQIYLDLLIKKQSSI